MSFSTLYFQIILLIQLTRFMPLKYVDIVILLLDVILSKQSSQQLQVIFIDKMSSQMDGLLQTNQSYNFEPEKLGTYKANRIEPAKFSDWQKDHMYKSSYAHFHSRDSVEPRVSSIPKYGGYIPYVRPEGIHAKGYTPVTKQCFNNQKLGKVTGLSTNGFNISRDSFIDQSQMASSSKYGKTAIQKAHPAWNEGPMKSSTHDFFRDPRAQINPTFRETDKFLQTNKPATKGSGFSTNHAYLDGQGWIPDRILKGDLNRTQYRDRFNAPISFHRDTFYSKQRRIRPNQMNYKYN